MRWILELALGAGWLVAVSAGAAAQDPAPAAAPSDPAAKPEGEAPPDQGTKPGGLLGIAEREAARSAKVLRDRILASLRNWTQKHDLEADRAVAPHAFPVLLHSESPCSLSKLGCYVSDEFSCGSHPALP